MRRHARTLLALAATAAASTTLAATAAQAYDVPSDWVDHRQDADGIQVVMSQEWCQDGTIPQVMLKVTSSRSESFSVGLLGHGVLDGGSATGVMYPTVSYDDAPLYESGGQTLLMHEWAIAYDSTPTAVAVLNVPHRMDCEGLPTTYEEARAAADAAPPGPLTLWAQGGDDWYDVYGNLHHGSGPGSGETQDDAGATEPAPATEDSGEGSAPSTQAPATQAPATQAPTTKAPTTKAPAVTQAPAASGPRIQTGTEAPADALSPLVVLAGAGALALAAGGAAVARRR